jgi:hypothetical protein
MHLQSIRKLAMLAGMAMLASMILPASARADLEIWASTTGAPGSYVELASAPTGTALFTAPPPSGFTGTVALTGNLPGTPLTATEFGTQLNITSSSAATLHLIFEEIGFTAPTAPPALAMSSVFSPSVTTGLNLSVSSYQSYADPHAVVNINGYTASGSATTTGSQTLTAAPNGSTATTTVPTLGSPYALVETLTVSFTAGGSLNSSTTTTLTTTPEPSTMTLAAIGSIALLGYNLRRRKARVA